MKDETEGMREGVVEGVKRVMLAHSWAAEHLCGMGLWPVWGGADHWSEHGGVEFVVPDQIVSIQRALELCADALKQRQGCRCRIRVREGVHRGTVQVSSGIDVVAEGDVEILGSLVLSQGNTTSVPSMSYVKNLRIVAPAGSCAIQVRSGRWTLEGCSAVCGLSRLERRKGFGLHQALSTEYETLVEDCAGGIYEEDVIKWLDQCARDGDVDMDQTSLRDNALKFLAAKSDDGALSFETFLALSFALGIEKALASRWMRSPHVDMDPRHVRDYLWRGTLGGVGILCSSSHVELVRCSVSGLDLTASTSSGQIQPASADGPGHGPALGWGVVVECGGAARMQECEIEHAMGAGLRVCAGSKVRMEGVLFRSNSAAMLYVEDEDGQVDVDRVEGQAGQEGDRFGLEAGTQTLDAMDEALNESGVTSIGMIEIHRCTFEGTVWGSHRRPVLSGSQCSLVGGRLSDVCRVSAKEVVRWMLESEGDGVPNVWHTNKLLPGDGQVDHERTTVPAPVSSDRSFLCDVLLSEYALSLGDHAGSPDLRQENLWEKVIESSPSALSPRPQQPPPPRVFLRTIRVCVSGYDQESAARGQRRVSVEGGRAAGRENRSLPDAICVVSTSGANPVHEVIDLKPFLVQCDGAVRRGDSGMILLELQDTSMADAARMLFGEVQDRVGSNVSKTALAHHVGAAAEMLCEPVADEGYTVDEFLRLCTSTDSGSEVLMKFMEQRTEDLKLLVAGKQLTPDEKGLEMNVLGETSVKAALSDSGRERWISLRRPWNFETGMGPDASSEIADE
eukprot:1289510-Rhodomonas_salina.1